MAIRRAARVLIIDPMSRVLLFEYSHSDKGDSLANKGSYFTVPGGRLLPHESFEECALRELLEETGLELPISQVLAVRQAPILVSSGETMLADERYYAVHVDHNQKLDYSKWTETEKRTIKRHLWCTVENLKAFNKKQLWPNTLVEILRAGLEYQHILQYKSTREQIGDIAVEVIY